MKAVLLCAGLGTRLGELTKDFPKPLLSVAGKTIVEYQIDQLKNAGILDIYINLFFCAEKIKEHLGDGKKFGVKITYFEEKFPSGTAGGVKCFEKNLKETENFIVIYGDIVSTESLAPLIERHLHKDAMATIFVHKRENSNSVIQFTSEGQVIEFLERPNEEELEKVKIPTKDRWVNSAIYCLNRKVLGFIPENKVCDFPKDIFPLLLAEKKLYAVPITQKRFAIDSVEKLNEANEFYQRKGE